MDAPALAHTASLESNASNTSSSSRKKVGSDFIFGAVLGEGSYSTVLHATDTDMNREYAVKMLDKKHIIRENKVKYVTVEKKVLHMIRHPLIVKLYHTFQDTHSLYFVLEYAPNGDLLEYLNKMGRFSVAATRFYIGEIILALECIHENGVIHRDLKPENILLDAEFHIKILNDPEDNEPDPLKRKASFVGTAEYCSPELLNDKSLVAGPSSDIWGLGCILFQLLVGYTPFKGSNEYQTFQKIITLNYRIPDQLESSSKDLIAYILQLAPERRPSLKAIKDSSFFEDFKWKELPCSTPPISTPIPALPGGQKLDDLPSRLENIQFDDETSSNSSREE